MVKTYIKGKKMPNHALQETIRENVKETIKVTPTWLTNFMAIYQQLTTDNLALLAGIYHQDVTFVDPMHRVEGFDNLSRYFKHLYQNLSSCKFTVEHYIVNGNEAAIYWQMTYQHEKFNKGKEVSVVGSSHIKGKEGKVYFHQDYVDLGSMLYEQLPVIGALIKWVKVKAVNS